VTRPSSVKADGVAVPFEFIDCVMTVGLQPTSSPIQLAIEK